MSTFELFNTYVAVVTGRFVGRVRSDDRGQSTAEVIVLVATAVVVAGVIAAILWGKLRDGANQTETPGPAAP
jgi:hypothetical protein